MKIRFRVTIRQDAKVCYEQLFDLDKDPWEMKNEMGNPKHQQVLGAMREKLVRWEEETKSVPPCPRVPKKTEQRGRTRT